MYDTYHAAFFYFFNNFLTYYYNIRTSHTHEGHKSSSIKQQNKPKID